ALTVGDINADGLENFFVGNAAGSPAAMYLQQENGEFEKLSGPWEKELDLEDTGALLFDADGDSDLDLYLVSGGNSKLKPKEFYQDRLYVNTPEGFKKVSSALPKITSSGQTVVSADFDNDGDLDLFVGGRIVPGKYPFPAKSHILRNEGGKDKSLQYIDVTKEMAPELTEAGLVTSALWDDFDNDGNIDLIITGEWMPIRFFKNLGHRFKEVTQDLGFNNSRGWWYGLQKMDVDADGDMDYLAGNLGLNYKYKASEKAPFEVYANDFDANGSMDIVLSYEKYGTKLPLRGRECSSQQVPAIKQRFKTFESFANADLMDIYGEKMLKQSLHYTVQTFAHQWIENKGDATYVMHSLPNRAQFSSINSFQEIDYNGDKYPDVVLGGNLYQSEVETPRNDSSVGLVMIGGPNGFELIEPNKSGLMVTGDIRNMAVIKLTDKNSKALLLARNNDSLKLKKVN
ncbi:MAG: VCBS repeat-containing protein, partial [Arenibacter sp.]|nr:VCBS repeat-containing protein [Arenibacter sp.]